MSQSPSTNDSAQASDKKSHEQIKVGVVASAKRDKTIAVLVPYLVRHPKYGKYVKRRTRLHVHDPENQAGLGDRVEVARCRPISKTKSWQLVRIVEKNTAVQPATTTV